MDEFYESLLNIKYYDQEKVLTEIKKIIQEELSDVLEYTHDMEGLCKVLSNNIKCRLDDVNLKNKKINISDFNKPEHEFVLASFKDGRKKINYILIDPTYRQFLEKDEKLLHYNNWPATLLKNSNESLLNDLLNCGCSIINEESFKNYMNSFEIETTLKDIILESYKEEPYETDIKNNKK